MSLYLFFKYLHLLGALLFLGTGLGSAFYKWQADRSQKLSVQAWCNRAIFWADLVFTIPSGLILPSTGWAMVKAAGFSWSSTWLQLGVAGYLSAGLLWLPAFYLQIKMEKETRRSVLSPSYARYQKIWIFLRIPAFLIGLATVAVMVFKPE